MSADEKISTKLIRTLQDGKKGFESAADKIADERADVAERFRALAAERQVFTDELQTIAAGYGDDIEEESSVAGALHRGWIAVKDALTGDDVDAVINAAKGGEDHSVEQYDEALADAEVSDEFRPVLARQRDAVVAARDYVASLTPDA